MAAKTGGKSTSKGKGPGQSKQSASRKQTTAQKQTAAHKGQGGQNKGTARSKERSGKEQSQSRRQKPGESQGKRGGMEQQGQQGQQNQQQAGVARRAAQSVKRHPVKAAVIAAGAAGAGVMLVKGLRKAVSSRGEGEEGDGQQGAQEDDEEDAGAQASDDEGEDEGESEEDEGEARGEAGNGSTRQAYQRGREAGINLAEDHPLLLAAAALLTGAAIGWLLPPSRQEDQLIGSFSDKVAGNLKKSAADIFGQGQEMLSRALSEGTDALAEEAEREGLTPQRLGRKLKRMAGHVREAVGGAIEA